MSGLTEKMRAIKMRSRRGEEIFNLFSDVDEYDVEKFVEDFSQREITEIVIDCMHFYNDVFINCNHFLEIDTEKMSEGEYLEKANRVKQMNDMASSDHSNSVIHTLLRKKNEANYMRIYRIVKDIVDKDWCEAGLFVKKN